MLLTDSEAARVRDPRPSLSPSRETASLRARACAVSLAIEEEEGASGGGGAIAKFMIH